MADKSFFGRLRRLFSTNVIIRNVGGRQLKIADTDHRQSFRNVATNFMYDKYSRLHTSQLPPNSGYGARDVFHAQRVALFEDYEGMDIDSIISSALDVYADESTMKNEFGDILTIVAPDENINKILNNLFYDVLNIEFNLWPWVRNMCKYGDFFLKLDIAEKYGITNVMPLPVYEIERLEGFDPSNPYAVKFALEGMSTQMLGGQAHMELENHEVAHFRLLSDSNFLPYGKSMVEGARKVWKQLTLMEDAVLIHRIMRAPSKRIFKLDIGNIPPNEVDNYMQQVINKMKKTPYQDQATGDYNLRYNIQNITEDFFLPVRGGDSGTSIDELQGAQWDSIEDVEYLRNRMLAALKIPKAFLGYEENVNAKATLAAEDVRFARTIERIQRILVSELTKLAIVHLYSQGYKDADLVNFSLALTNPSTIYEQEKVELWSNKMSLASSMMQDNLMSTEWIYDNIFSLDTDQKEQLRKDVIEDQKRNFRYEQIKMEGNDPVRSEQSFGTPHDLAVLQMQGEQGRGQGAPEPGNAPQEEIEVPNGGWNGAGRPKEVPKYSKDGSARGRDPLGSKDRKTFTKVGTPLSVEQINSIVKGMPNIKTKTIISETFESKNGKLDNLKISEKEDKKTFLDEDKLLNVSE